MHDDGHSQQVKHGTWGIGKYAVRTSTLAYACSSTVESTAHELWLLTVSICAPKRSTTNLFGGWWVRGAFLHALSRLTCIVYNFTVSLPELCMQILLVWSILVFFSIHAWNLPLKYTWSIKVISVLCKQRHFQICHIKTQHAYRLLLKMRVLGVRCCWTFSSNRLVAAEVQERRFLQLYKGGVENFHRCKLKVEGIGCIFSNLSVQYCYIRRSWRSAGRDTRSVVMASKLDRTGGFVPPFPLSLCNYIVSCRVGNVFLSILSPSAARIRHSSMLLL